MAIRRAVDVVVVGARCAGSALACFLADSGARVLVVDRAPLPSEHVLSTHTLHPAGMRIVEELGLDSSLRREAPAMKRFKLEREQAKIEVELSDDQAEYCPRRERFDGLLQDRARAAGVEVEARTNVTEVLWDGARAVGVRARDSRGVGFEIRAGLVVGADGRASTIARHVGADEYFGYDAPRAMYWGYFPAPRSYVPTMNVAFNDGMIRVAFATERGEVLVGCLPAVSDAKRYRDNPLRSLRRTIQQKPELAELVARDPSEPVRGVLKTRYFMRRAVGPGWALVGDAGMHKEFVSGDGMSEALLSAKRLARAISKGREEAFRRYWYERDTLALSRFCFYRDQGALGTRSRFECYALSRAALDESTRRRFAKTFEHEVSPYEVIAPTQALRWAISAFLHGHLSVWTDVYRMARRAAEVKELIRATAERVAFQGPSAPEFAGDFRVLSSSR